MLKWRHICVNSTTGSVSLKFQVSKPWISRTVALSNVNVDKEQSDREVRSFIHTWATDFGKYLIKRNEILLQVIDEKSTFPVTDTLLDIVIEFLSNYNSDIVIMSKYFPDWKNVIDYSSKYISFNFNILVLSNIDAPNKLHWVGPCNLWLNNS